MSLEDWTFEVRATGVATFNNFIDFSTPFNGLGSLIVEATGTPSESTVAIHPDTSTIDTGFSSGRIRTVFEKRIGSGFREHGIYFLSNRPNPTEDGTACYIISVSDGAQSIRIMRASNGIHGNNPGLTTIQTFSDSPSTPIPNATAASVLQVDWFSGALLEEFGGVKIIVSFAHNTIDFNDLITFPEFVDSFALSGGTGEGIFTRSRASSEVVSAKFDDTSIFRLETV